MIVRVIHRWLKVSHRLRALGVACLFLLVFTLFGYQYLQNSFSFNSDNLYCLQLCDDLLHGRDMQGFHMPAAPYLFPDVALLLPCAALTSNLSAVFFLYSALYYSLLFAVLIAVFCGIGLSRRTAFVTAGLGVSFLLASHFGPTYATHNLLMFHPGNHMGCLLIGLGVIAFVQRALRNSCGWRAAVLFVPVCALSGFSDQLLIVQFLVPIGTAVLLMGAFRRVPARRVVVTAVLLGLSTVLAVKGRILFLKLGLMPMRVTHVESSLFKNVTGALEQLAASWCYVAKNQLLMWVVLALHVAAAVAVIGVWARPYRSLAPSGGSAKEPGLDGTAVLFVTLVLLLAPLANAAALIVTGSTTPAFVLRYLYTWWFLPFPCLLLWPSLLPWRAVRLVPWAVVILVGFRILTYPEVLRKDRFAPRYPPLAQALDEIARKYGPLRGFSEFWHSREMTYLTRQHVDVLPILDYGAPWFHSINPNGYLSGDPRDLSVPDYHFVVFAAGEEAGPDREQIRTRYGEPVEIISTEGYDIWRYERMVNRQLDLFLRAQLAQRLVRNKPFIGPVQPASLREPKRNLTPREERGNIHLRRGEPLSVRFDRPVTGAMIDIGGDFMDEYVLLYLRDGEELGTTRVPPVTWTGAEHVYGEPGLQSRLVPVPPACCPEGFDEVRITSVGRMPDATLGHFLVFEKWIPYRSGRGTYDRPYRRHEGEKLTHADAPELTAIADSSASGGMAWRSASTFQGCMAFGPYFPLSPGRYCVDFALAVTDNTSSEVVATIDCCAFGGRQILHSRTLRGVDFAVPGRYAVFRFTFDIEEELDLVELRTIVHGMTAVTLDYVDVTREIPAATSEVCEP